MKIHPATATDFAWIEFDTEDEAEIGAIALELQERCHEVTLGAEDWSLVLEAMGFYIGELDHRPETMAMILLRERLCAKLRNRLDAAAGGPG